MDFRTALQTVLDQVDYTAGNCRPNEMVGAVLPKEILTLAHNATEDNQISEDVTTRVVLENLVDAVNAYRQKRSAIEAAGDDATTGLSVAENEAYIAVILRCDQAMPMCREKVQAASNTG